MTKDMLHIVIPLVGSGLAGSMFSYFAVKRRDRYIADLRITIFPSLESERGENDHVQCFAKFTMKSGPKPISEMELIPKLGSSKQLQLFPSRPGFESDKTAQGTVLLRKMTKGDFISILFLTPKSILSARADPSLHLVDYRSADTIYVQRSISLNVDC